MNVYMKKFVKKFALGVIIGALLVTLCALIPILKLFKWYIVPLVVLALLLYGTGLVFSMTFIKKTLRKFLKIDSETPIRKGITESGWVWGIVYSIICIIVGLVIAFFVGNYFMIRDFLNAKKNKPPVSAKHRFDNNEAYEKWAEDLAKKSDKAEKKAAKKAEKEKEDEASEKDSSENDSEE